MTSLEKVRGRFAPSPSGELHLGNAWTALLAWLQVRSQRGIMVLRMEDLDPERSHTAYATGIMRDLAWLGLDWDEGPDIGGPYSPYVQNERCQLYQEVLDKLICADLIYPCYCSRAEIQNAASAPHAGEGECIYPGTCRSNIGGQKNRFDGRKPALRLKVPDQTLTFDDGVRGQVVQNLAKTTGDFIVRRSDGVHAYQLAVVVDDAMMRISHVLRGDDLLMSTPRQLFLYQTLKFTPPKFMHVPLLYSPDGRRLSKRQQHLTLAALRQRKVAAEKIVGYLAWKAGLLDSWQSVRSADLVSCFSLENISRKAVIVDYNAFL